MTDVASHPEFAILGAGAIGSIIGAHLARAGHAVTMLARGQRAEHIRGAGLQIRGLIEFDIGVPVLSDASQLASADVLIVAMKTAGTRAALQPLRQTKIGAAFSIQNGVWKNDQLVEAFGQAQVLGSLANTSGELLPSGEVLFTRNINIFVGELGGGLSDRAQRIAGQIDASGVHAQAVADILAREWTKFVGWVGLMTMSVATRAATWKYLSDPDCATLLVRFVREMSVLAKASGIELTNQHSLLPIQTILAESEEAGVAAVIRSGLEFRQAAPEHRMSSLQDLLAGRPLEIEETLGDAVNRAKALGLSLPLLETCYRLALSIDGTARV